MKLTRAANDLIRLRLLFLMVKNLKFRANFDEIKKK